ncbi:MAG TPA: Mur ligase family protein [Clostridiaceae bacterium]
MKKIKVNTFLSIIISKITITLSKKIFKGGSNFPGRVALRLDKNILASVACGYKIIIVTGTNGKTTTTSMIYNMLIDNNLKVITNNTGANMLPGITSTFIENYRFRSKKEDKYAVIEVDEANLRLLTPHIEPIIITVTNLFRDQLDRYGEVYTTLTKIIEGMEKVPKAMLVLNGDESLLGGLPVVNSAIYYGFNLGVQESTKVDINADSKFCKKCKNPYSYKFITYSHLGSYYCESCGYRRPNLDYHIDNIIELTSKGSLVHINGQEYYMHQGGIYNIYNGLNAYAVAKYLDVPNSVIYNSLKSQKSSFGRQEIVSIFNKEVKIILVKNPAGFDQAISTLFLEKNELSLAILLNDNYADGRDVSWIWDVDFEILTNLNINKLFFGGNRLYDMATRIKIAGLKEDKFVYNEKSNDLMDYIRDNNNVYILATYTAMLDFRKLLYKKGYIKKRW